MGVRTLALALIVAAVLAVSGSATMAHATPPEIPCDLECQWPMGTHSETPETITAGVPFPVSLWYAWEGVPGNAAIGKATVSMESPPVDPDSPADQLFADILDYLEENPILAASPVAYAQTTDGAAVTIRTSGDVGYVAHNSWVGTAEASISRASVSVLESDAEFASLSSISGALAGLAAGTAQISVVNFEPNFGSRATTAPTQDTSEWELIEGAAGDVDGSCERVAGAGTPRDLLGVVSVRSGSGVVIVHDALSSTASRLHAIYDPDSSPSVPNTQDSYKGCAYLADRNDHVEITAYTAATSALGITADRIVVSFSEDIALRTTPDSQARATRTTFGQDCSLPNACISRTAMGISVGPGSDSLTIEPVGHTGFPTAPFDVWSTSGRFEVTWVSNSASSGILRANDAVLGTGAPLSRNIAVPPTLAVTDGLPPAVSDFPRETGPNTLILADEPAVADGPGILEGVDVWRTPVGGAREPVAVSGTSRISTPGSFSYAFSLTATPPLAATDHVELVGLADSEGNVSVKPAIASVEREGRSRTVVVLSEPVSGTTRAGHWFVSGEGAGEPRVRAVGVSPGRTTPAPDATAGGLADVAVVVADHIALSHAPVSSSSALTVEYVPPAPAGFGKLDGRLGSSGLLLEAQTVSGLPFTARATAPGTVEVTLHGGTAGGTTAAADWSVGAAAPASVSVPGTAPAAGSVTVSASGAITLHLPASAILDGLAPSSTLSYSAPRSGGVTIAGEPMASAGPVPVHDGIAPTLTGARFAGPTTVLVGFSEPVSVLPTASVTPPGESARAADAPAAQSAHSRAIAVTVPSASDGDEYDVELRDVRDAAGNPFAVPPAATTATYEDGMYVSTARTVSSTRTTVDLGGSLALWGGSTLASEWSLVERVDGADVTRAVTGVGAGTAEPVASYTHTSIIAPSPPRLTLVHEALSSPASVPEVRHSSSREARLSTGADASAFASDADVPLLSTSVPHPEAADGVAPTVLLVTFTTPTRILLQFSEPMTASFVGWSITGSRGSPEFTSVMYGSTDSIVTLDVTGLAEGVEYTIRPPAGFTDMGSNASPTARFFHDTISPMISSARTTSASVIEVTMSEDVVFGGEPTAAQRGAPWRATIGGVAHTPIDASVDDLILTLTFAADSLPTAAVGATLAYTDPGTNVAGRILDTASKPLASVASAPLADGAGPEIVSVATRETDNGDGTYTHETVVTLSEAAAVQGSPTADEIAGHWGVSWSVDGVSTMQMVTGAAVSGSTVVLSHANLPDTGTTPLASYTRGDAAGRLVSAADGNVLADDDEMAATDGIRPRATSISFTDASTITVAFSEAVSLPSDPAERLAAFALYNSENTQPAGTVSAANPQTASTVITLSLASPVADGVYSLRLANTITDSAGLAHEADVEMATMDTTRPTFTAGATSLGTTAIEFSEPVHGTLDTSDWAIRDDPDGAAGPMRVVSRAITAMSYIDANGMTVTATPGAPVTIAATGATRVFTVAHESLSSANPTAALAYSGTRITDAFSFTVAATAPASPATIADRIAPSILQAEFLSATTVHVTFSEPVTTPSSGWTATGSLSITSAAEGLAPHVVALTVTGAQLNLGYTFTVPAPATPDTTNVVRDRSTSANAVEPGAQITARYSQSAPALASLEVTVLRDDTDDSVVNPTVRMGSRAELARVGDLIRVTATLATAAPAGAANVPTIAILGGSASNMAEVTVGSPAPPARTQWTSDHMVDASSTEGPVTFTLTTKNAQATSTASEDDITSGGATVDTTAPAHLETAFEDADTLIIRFSEQIYAAPSTISVTPAGGTATSPSTSHTVGSSAIRINLASSASAGVVHTVAIPSNSFLDRADNAASASSQTATYEPAPTVTGAETSSLTTTTVTFSAAVRGTVGITGWTMTDPDSVSTTDDTRRVTGFALAADGMSATLTHERLRSTASTPTVAYDGTALLLGDAGHLMATSPAITATDGVPPKLVRATFGSASTIRIVFSEPLANSAVEATYGVSIDSSRSGTTGLFAPYTTVIRSFTADMAIVEGTVATVVVPSVAARTGTQSSVAVTVTATYDASPPAVLSTGGFYVSAPDEFTLVFDEAMAYDALGETISVTPAGGTATVAQVRHNADNPAAFTLSVDAVESGTAHSVVLSAGIMDANGAATTASQTVTAPAVTIDRTAPFGVLTTPLTIAGPVRQLAFPDASPISELSLDDDVTLRSPSGETIPVSERARSAASVDFAYNSGESATGEYRITLDPEAVGTLGSYVAYPFTRAFEHGRPVFTAYIASPTQVIVKFSEPLALRPGVSALSGDNWWIDETPSTLVPVVEPNASAVDAETLDAHPLRLNGASPDLSPDGRILTLTLPEGSALPADADGLLVRYAVDFADYASGDRLADFLELIRSGSPDSMTSAILGSNTGAYADADLPADSTVPTLTVSARVLWDDPTDGVTDKVERTGANALTAGIGSDIVITATLSEAAGYGDNAPTLGFFGDTPTLMRWVSGGYREAWSATHTVTATDPTTLAFALSAADGGANEVTASAADLAQAVTFDLTVPPSPSASLSVVNNEITIDFGGPVYGVPPTMALSKSGATATPSVAVTHVDGDSTATMTIPPTLAFVTGDIYTITIPPNTIHDVGGNTVAGGPIMAANRIPFTIRTSGDVGYVAHNSWAGTAEASLARASVSVLESDAEFASLSSISGALAGLAAGTAQISVVNFEPNFGDRATTAPTQDTSEWELIEGAASDVDGSCERVAGAGTPRALLGVVSVRSGAGVVIVHDALSSTASRLHAIYDPDSSPSVPNTQDSYKGCAYLADRNDHVEITARTASSDAFGITSSRIVVSFSEDIALRTTPDAQARATRTTFARDCSVPDACVSRTAMGISVGPGSDSLTIEPVGHTGFPAAPYDVWSASGRFEVTWVSTAASSGILRASDAVLGTGAPLSRNIAAPPTLAVTDGLPPSMADAPGGLVSNTLILADEPAVADGPGILEGVDVWRTPVGGAREPVAVSGVSRFSVPGSFSYALSLTATPPLAATDHVELVGLADSEGNVSVKPAIASVEREGRSRTVVVLSEPVSGTTRAGHWFVSGEGAGEPRARAVGVSPGRTTPAPDATAGGLADVAVVVADHIALSHAPVSSSSALTVEYVPPAPAGFGKLDGRLGSSGLLLEAQVVSGLPFTARATAPGTVEVTLHGGTAGGTTSVADWSVGGGAPASVSVPGTAPAAGSVTVPASGAITLHLPPSALLDDSTPSSTLSYSAPSSGGVTIAGEPMASAGPVPVHDGIAPTLTAARFAGPTTVLVGFSEPVSVLPTASVTPPGERASAADAAAAQSAHSRAIAVTVPSASDGDEYNVELRDVRDAAGNPFAVPPAATTATYEDGMYVSTARTVSSTRTTVDLGGSLALWSGSTLASEWSLVERVDGADVTRAVTGVGAGTTEPVASYTHTSVAAPSPPRLTLVHEALSSPASVPEVRHSSSREARLSTGADASAFASDTDVPLLSTSVPHPEAADGAPPTIASAEFTAANMIAIMFSEALGGTRASIEGLTYAVSAPDGTVTPDDADGDADMIPLAAPNPSASPPVRPVSYDAASQTITLTLASAVPIGVIHTVTLPATLADEGGTAIVDLTEEVVYGSLPTASFTFTVLDAVSQAPKSGAYANMAGIGDTIRVDLDLDIDVMTPPRITLAGRDTTSVPMGNAGDADASTWRHDHLVDSSHASTSAESPLEISILVTDNDGVPYDMTPTTNPAQGTTVTLPEIDTVRPTAMSLTVAVMLAGQAVDAAVGTVAAISDDLLVRLTASETLVTDAADIVFFGRTGVNADMVTDGGSNLHTYDRTILDTDTSGTLTFSLTMRDTAGNTATLTQDNLTGTNVAVDADAPTVTAMSHSDTMRTITLTFSEGLLATTAVAANFEVRGFTESTQMRSSSALALNTAHGTAGVAYAPGTLASDTSTVSIGLDEDDSYAVYKVVISPLVTDTNTNAYVPILNPDDNPATDDSDITVQKTDMTAPRATELSVIVHDGTPGTNTAKTGLYDDFAGIDDTVRVDVTLNEDAVGTPTIDIAGATGISMADRGDDDATTWRYDLVVSGTTTETTSLDFTINVTDGTTSGTITATTGHMGTLMVSRPTVDRTVPTATVTTSVRLEDASSDSSTVTTAGIDDEARVTLTASEALDARVADIALFGLTGASTVNADSVEGAGANAYAYVRTIASGDVGGEIEFSVTFRDRAGNAGASALTHGDAAARVTVDATTPTIVSAETVSTTTLTVTLSEDVTGTGTWSAESGSTTAVISSADVSGDTVTLTYGTIDDTSFAPTVRYTGTGIVDAGRNALQSGSSTPTADGVAPTATAAFTGQTITITFSEPVNGVTPTLTLTQPNGETIAPTFFHDDGDITASATLDGALPMGSWRVAIPASVEDVSENPLDAASRDISVGFSVAPTAISYTVFEQDGSTARQGALAAYARADDQIRLSVTLDGSASMAPTVLFVGKTAPSDTVTMTQVGSTDEWRATYTVETAAAAPDIDGRFTFAMSVTGAVSGVAGTITDRSLSTVPPTIDHIAPTISAQTSGLREISVTFGNPVSGATVASEWRIGGTLATGISSGGPAQAGELSLTNGETLTLHLSEAGALADGSVRPAVVFTARATGGLADIAGNPVADASVTAVDRIPPRLDSMEFDGSRTIIVTLSEPIDGDTLGTIPPNSLRPSLGAIGHDYTQGSTSLTLGTAERARAGATHSLTLPASVTDVANPDGVARNAISRDSVSATLLNVLPLTFTARTYNASHVIVTFSEPVQGTTAASEWTFEVPPSDVVTPDGTVPAVTAVSAKTNPTMAERIDDTIDASSAFTGPFYVGHKDPDDTVQTRIWGPGATPVVTFMEPSDGLTNVVAAGETPVALPTRSVTAGDGIEPKVLSALFVTQGRIHVIFDEDVSFERAGWSVSGLDVTDVTRGSGDTVVLDVNPPTVAGVAHTVEIARSSVRDGGSNELEADARITGVEYRDTITFAAKTQRDSSGTHIRVVFGDDVRGTTVASEWTIGVGVDGSGGAQADSILVRCTSGGSLMAAASVNVADICSGEDPEPRTFYLEYDAPDSGATPRVAYAAPTAQGATPIVSGFNGLPISSRAVLASDGLAPLFAAVATATSRTLEVTFDEDVMAADGGPDASRWHHYDSAGMIPTQAELDAAVIAGTSFASAELDGRTLTLTLPGSYAPVTGWGSGDTAAVPTTIGYNVPAGESPDILDVSSAANGLAGGIATRDVVDAAPPEADTLTVIVVEDPDSDGTFTPKSGTGMRTASIGDAISATITLSEPSSSSSPPTFGALGEVQVMTLSNSDTTATGAIAVPLTWARDGPLEFSIVLTDATVAANTATLTQADLVGEPIDVDVNEPTIESVLRVSSTSLQFVFSEEVTGTGTVSASADSSPDPATDPSAPLLIRPSPTGRIAVAALALAGSHTFTLGAGITDVAGNAIAAQEVAIDDDGEFESPALSAPASGALPLSFRAPGERPAPITLLTDDLVADASGTFGADLTATVGGVSLTIRSGTILRDLGPTDAGATAGTLVARLTERAAATVYVGAIVAADADATDYNELVAAAINSREPHTLVVLGKEDASTPVLLSRPAAIRIDGVSRSSHIFYIDGAELRDVHGMRTCAEAGHGDADATTAPTLADATSAALADECYVRDDADVVIWTNHLTLFGASLQGLVNRVSGCSDCTPPTLGVDGTGTRRVSGGFEYNGDVTDAEYYHTPLPLITVETGQENVAILKVFEDTGPRNVRHVGLGFGLERGQHFAESRAEIHVDMPYGGGHTVRLDDPDNAIDADTLDVHVDTVKCMPGSDADCRLVMIRHTFRTPLEFSVVSTIVWDDRRNAWQNTFNHGVHVTGESLNARHGIPVNDGNLVLYPLISGHVDGDGDGIYDYDVRHVTYMLDSDYRVYRLAVDGTYQPLRNLASLLHELDEPLYWGTEYLPHGPARGTELFEGILEEERKIAADRLVEVDLLNLLRSAADKQSQ